MCVRARRRIASCSCYHSPCLRRRPITQHGQASVGFKAARRRRSGAIEQLQHHKWEFPITAKVRAANCWRISPRICVCVCLCVCARVSTCVCVQCSIFKRLNRKNNEKTKQICERPLLSPSRHRDPGVSGLHEIAVNWRWARVGNPCTVTHALIPARTYAERHRQTGTHTHTHTHTHTEN